MKSTFLKVMAILVLVFGIIGLIVNIVGVGPLAYLGFPVAGTVISIIECILMIVAGVMGIRVCDRPEKAGTAMILGIILIVLAVLALIVSIAEMGATQQLLNTLTSAAGVANMNIGVDWTNFTGLIMPVLYFLAAFLFKKKAEGK